MRVLVIPEDFRKDEQVLKPMVTAVMGAVGRPRAKVTAENAWQEVEVWVLAGHDLPLEWVWTEIRADRDPKEQYFEPLARLKGVIDQPAQGRGTLALQAARRYDRVRTLCEEVRGLEDRIRAKVG
ncbi:MAG TPA: hypothetical protein VK191_05745 [Symbiobacteriaceae bacterium]|nr:hypothetical protein [Symbiobacteriaceae bacterium]